MTSIIKLFILLALLISTCKAESMLDMQDKDAYQYKEVVERLICHQINSFNRLISINGFIPNKTTESGRADVSSDLVQPRMIQFYLNIILLRSASGSDNFKCAETDDAVENFKSLYERYSKNESVIYPWKEKVNGNKSNDPMDIYDLGDWLMISNVYYLISKDKNKTTEYIRHQANILMEALSDHRVGSFAVDYEHPNIGGREIGHLTLALDSLILSSATLKDDVYSNFVSKQIDEVVAMRRGKYVLEDPKNPSSTHLMTYGELFETIFFLDMVKGNLGRENILFEDLYSDYKKYFKMKSGYLNYYTNDSDNYCFNSMAFEAAFYRPLLYYYSQSDQNQLNFISKQIAVYERKLGVPPVSERCISEKKIKSDDAEKIMLGQLYGYIKIKRIQEILNLDKKAKNKIKKTLDYINSNIQAIGFANFRGDKLQYKGIADIGANVWLTNEALIPLYHSFFSPNSMLHDMHGSFHGGNYIFIIGEATDR